MSDTEILVLRVQLSRAVAALSRPRTERTDPAELAALLHELSAASHQAGNRLAARS